MTEVRQEMFDLGELNPALEDVWFIEGSTPDNEPQETSNIYILDQGRVVIDTGNISELAWYIQERFPVGAIEKVVITHPHFDHTTGLSIILSVANPKIYIHPDALPYTYMGVLSLPKMTKECGREEQIVHVSDGDVIEAGSRTLEVIHTPGHMVGGICLYDRASESLFSQDLVFPSTYEANYLSYPDERLGDAMELIESLKKLLAYPVKNLLPGHFLPSFGDGGEHIKNAYKETVKHFIEDKTKREEESWVKLAAALADHGRLEEAIECFDVALEKSPKNISASLSKALALTELARYQEAMDIFDKILELRPDTEEAAIGKGFCLLGLGKPEEALKIEAFKAKVEAL